MLNSGDKNKKIRKMTKIKYRKITDAAGNHVEFIGDLEDYGRLEDACAARDIKCTTIPTNQHRLIGDNDKYDNLRTLMEKANTMTNFTLKSSHPEETPTPPKTDKVDNKKMETQTPLTEPPQTEKTQETKPLEQPPIEPDKYKRGDIIREGIICLSSTEALNTRKMQVHSFIARTGSIFGVIRKASEEDKSILPSGKPKEERALATTKTRTPVQPPNTKPETLKHNVAKRGEMYEVSGNIVPDAALTQQFANKAGISSKILSCEMNENFLKAVVRSKKGEQYIDVCMIIDFAVEAQLTIMQKWKKQKNKDPWVVMKDLNDTTQENHEINKAAFEAQVKYEILMKKQFASRTAVTKARRQGQLALLNKEYREDEEKASEDTETEVIENDKY